MSTATPQNRRWPEHRLFLWLAPLLYLAFALVTPPFQTPDEQQHFFRAWQLSEGILLGERQGDRVGGPLPASLSEAAAKEIGTAEPHEQQRPKPVRSWGASPSTTLGDVPKRFTNFLGSAVYPPSGYAPQVVGVWIGRLVGLTVENIVRLGRILNAALAIALLAVAMRLSPVGKRVMLFIGLLPMTAACAASLGQDGLVIGGTCLLIAFGLRQWVNRPWSRREAVTAAVLALATGLAKPVYLPFALLGMRPLQWRGQHIRANMTPLLIAGGTVIAIGLWQLAAAHLIVPVFRDVPPVGERLTELLHQPGTFLGMVGQTLDQRAFWLIGTLASFGWMNVGPVGWAAWTLMLLPLLLLLSGEQSDATLSAPARLWLLLIGLGSALLIALVAWLLWTPQGSPIISGLQGRYFIPPLAAVLIAASPRRAIAPRAWLAVPSLQLVANVAVLQTITATYYL